MKTALRLLLRLLFRFRIFNGEVLTAPGPVLLVPNHVSWLDWIFLLPCLDDDWRFVTSSVTAQTSWLHKIFMVNHRTFPIDTGSPYGVKHMAEHLRSGGRLVLFAEGQISHTGSLMKVFDGTGFLVFKSNAKVITCYLRGANRLWFARQPGWRRLFPRVTIHFSPILHAPKLGEMSTTAARTKLTNWLRERMVAHQFEVEMEQGPDNVLRAIVEAGGRQPGKLILQDATNVKLTYRKLLAAADVFSAQLRLHLQPEPPRVGVLLPNLAATPIAVLALWALGKVPAVLNFSTGMQTMVICAELAQVRQIITSRLFLERTKLAIEPLTRAGVTFLYLEDLRAGIGSVQKFLAVLRSSLIPDALAHQQPLLGTAAGPDDPALVLFTSGSEGTPKGVELSHRNILTNIRQMLAVTDIEDRDRLFNALPLFHSFGLVVGLLLPLTRGIYTFLYPSPLHYRVVPTALYGSRCTIFLSTNTFLNGYARKAHPYDFRTMRYLFAAAEKVQETTFQTWAQRFGVRLLEGYGATECSPCLSVNTPLAPRYGSAGKLLPGIEYKLELIEGVHDGGRLLVRGPNVMRGYLNPDANEKFKELCGWYDTGDIVRVDDEGYLYILGRLKRFAKVSGEMVSLTAVEDALAGAFPQYGLRCQVAVLARPDPDKGEVLVAVTNEPKLTIEEVRAAIRAKGLGNLCVPREIRVMHEIPKLGTGKVDHRLLATLLQPPGPPS